jgi:hypothetical protein
MYSKECGLIGSSEGEGGKVRLKAFDKSSAVKKGFWLFCARIFLKGLGL